MHPDIEELVVRAVFDDPMTHYAVLMPVLSWMRPGGELQWTLTTPNAMSKCACVSRSWNNALAQCKKLHLAQLAARAVKMSIEYGLGVCEVERYLHADIHAVPQTTTFSDTLRLDKEHVFFITFKRTRWFDIVDMDDQMLDEYRVWYVEKKRELKTWLETQLVLLGVMPLEHM
jgi:hypothetical protein